MQLARAAAKPLIDFLEVNVPRLLQSRPRPMSIPTSPTRLTMNALLAASQLLFSSYQKPISKYEQTPTSSQKMKIMKTFFDATRPSIEKQNSERYVKNRGNRGSSCMYPIE